MGVQVRLHKIGEIDEADLKYVVICVKCNKKWLLGRHKERATWEMAGGHMEDGESARIAAIRELYEESGIETDEIEAIGDYDVYCDENTSFGRLFYVEVRELGELPDYEIAEVKLFDEFPLESSTYPQIYEMLIEWVKEYETTRLVLKAKGVETNIYFVRHAQPDRSFTDDRQIPLTERGMADTKLVTGALQEKNIQAIYSSPFKRAYDTVKDLADTTGLDIKVVEDFRERKVDDVWVEDFRAFTRKQWENFNFRLESGECLREVQERNIAALYDVLKCNMGRNVAIGSHGTALSTIINYFNSDFGYDDFWAIAGKMPYIVCFRFDNMDFIGIEDIL